MGFVRLLDIGFYPLPLNPWRVFRARKQMSHNKNAFQLMQELLDMPEFQIHSSIQELNTSIYIFEENYNDLRRLVNFLAVDSRSEHLLLLTGLWQQP